MGAYRKRIVTLRSQNRRVPELRRVRRTSHRRFSGFPAASETASGEMFFGFSNGAISFFPDEIEDDSTPPPVVLTDFRLFGAPVSVGGDSVLKESISVARPVTLPPSQNTFSLEFAALSFRSPERNRYRFRMENLEKRWNETGSNGRFMSYSAVAPGDYVFRVQASDGRGKWNEAGASLRIESYSPGGVGYGSEDRSSLRYSHYCGRCTVTASIRSRAN